MHIWGQPRMNLSCLNHRVSYPNRLSPQTGVRPSWSHERRTLHASDYVLTSRTSTTLSSILRFQSTPPAIAVADIAGPKAKSFMILNALKCYDQCPLDKDNQLLTTFITPFGRYKFMRAPFGFSPISEHYDCRMYEAFQGFTDFCHIVDGVLLFDEDLTSHVNHVRGARNKAFLLAVTSYGIVRRKSSLLVFIYPRMANTSVMTSSRPSVASPPLPVELTSDPSLVWSIN